MIKKEEAKHIAGLARIGVSQDDVEKISADLSSILNWMDELNEKNVDFVSIDKRGNGPENVAREDRFEEFENKEGIVKLFPESKNGYDKVKSVL